MKELGYHPHFVNLVGYVLDINSPLLILEYCAYGDLLTLVRNNRNKLFAEVLFLKKIKQIF